MGSSQSRVNWSRLDEETFNDLVENLLVREYTTDGQLAMAVDGRGGDGGIDIDVRARRTDQLINIFQLKYFPEGFSGGHVKRRDQIRRSFNEAMKHNPPVWTLVVPRKVTVQERKAVRAMRKGRKVTVRFMTPTEMDLLLAKHPDIEERFTTDRAVELLAAVHRPEAALTKPGDLHSEVRRISDRLHGRSEYWGTSFSLADDGTYLESYFAKRPDALEREPLGVTFTLGFAPDDVELQSQFESAMKFGVTEAVVLPPRVIQSFEKSGPEWFREELSEIEVQLGPAGEENDPKPVRVELRDRDGRALANLRGNTVWTAHGYGGMTFEAQFDGGMSQRWTLPADHAESGSVTFTVDFIDSTAREIRRVLRFIGASEAATALALSFDGVGPIVMVLPGPADLEPDRRFIDFIDDLCFLEDHFDVPLRLTSDFDGTDVVWARVMRLLVEGQAVAHPYDGSFGGTLDGNIDDGLRILLTEGRAVSAHSDGFGLQMFGELLELPDIAYYSHHAVVDDAVGILQALEGGTAADMKLAVRPIDGLPWVIYSPSYLQRAGRETVITQPWGIDGIREHPGYARLPNRAGEQVADRPALGTGSSAIAAGDDGS